MRGLVFASSQGDGLASGGPCSSGAACRPAGGSALHPTGGRLLDRQAAHARALLKRTLVLALSAGLEERSGCRAAV